jgi:hypothetical protein
MHRVKRANRKRTVIELSPKKRKSLEWVEYCAGSPGKGIALPISLHLKCQIHVSRAEFGRDAQMPSFFAFNIMNLNVLCDINHTENTQQKAAKCNILQGVMANIFTSTPEAAARNHIVLRRRCLYSYRLHAASTLNGKLARKPTPKEQILFPPFLSGQASCTLFGTDYGQFAALRRSLP